MNEGGVGVGEGVGDAVGAGVALGCGNAVGEGVAAGATAFVAVGVFALPQAASRRKKVTPNRRKRDFFVWIFIVCAFQDAKTFLLWL